MVIILRGKSSWYHSIRWQLLMTYIIIILIAFLFATQLIVETLRRSFYHQRKTTLFQQANVIAGESVNFLKQDDKESLPFEFQLMQLTEKMYNTRIMVIAKEPIPTYVADTIQKESKKGKYPPIEFIDNIINGEQGEQIKTIDEDINMYVIVPVTDNAQENKVLGAVQLVASINDIQESINDIQKKLYILSIIIGLIVGILSYFFSTMITNPIQYMIGVIEKMAGGQLHQRIEIHGHDEISELGNAFNVMSEQLEQIDSSRQEFVSNASHELKTPLSSMKVLIESLLIQEGLDESIYREFLRDINSEINRLTNIINDLLEMVKLDKMAPLHLKDVSLSSLISSIIKRIQPLASQKNIEIQFENKKNITAKVDEIKISQAISNLVDNAIKYSNEGGIVEIRLNQEMYHIIIEVQDYGMGIPEEDQNKIFERFYRVDKMRSRDSGGTGLGLSIAHKSILMHGGKISLHSVEEEGTTFTVYLPKRN